MSKSARVFNISQYEFNPKTGEDLHFNEDNIISCLNHRTIKQWAYICHDKDICIKDDEVNGYSTGEKKPRHWHIVLKCDRALEIDTLAKWLGIPANMIEVPRGGNSAFLDCVQYLTHEDEKQQALGKYFYDDEEVKANFDFRQALNAREENKLKYGTDLTAKQKHFVKVLYEGQTIRQLEKEDYIFYMENMDKVHKYRLQYIQNQDPPKSRLNFYICGSGGIGKDLLSRGLARCLFPQYTRDEDIFFIVGSDNATFEGYDGQPCIIWSDFRAIELLNALGRRGNVFKVFDTHPTKQRQNIKYGSVNLINKVNIVNGVDDYITFLDGLAGEYKMKNGDIQRCEDNQKQQCYRRFPFIMPLQKEFFDLLINKGYMNDGDFMEYEEYGRIRANMQRIAIACNDNEQQLKEYEQKVLGPVATKSYEAEQRHLTYNHSEDYLETISGEILPIPRKGEYWCEQYPGANVEHCPMCDVCDRYLKDKNECLPF